MRKMTIAMASTLALALALGATAGYAQAPSAQPPARDESPAQTIRSITVVDIDELPAATQTQVKTTVAQISEADLQKLRASIDATPQAATALRDKGMTSAQVVAINFDRNGTLMIVTNKKAT